MVLFKYLKLLEYSILETKTRLLLYFYRGQIACFTSTILRH